MKVTYKYQCRTDMWVEHYIMFADGKPVKIFVAGYDNKWVDWNIHTRIPDTAVDISEEDMVLNFL